MATAQITQQLLDSTQYTVASIQHYEAVFGVDFVSPGGHDMAVELITRLGLRPGSRVLDVGCGLGGSSFVMAREFGLIADGIDLSKNMLALATKKLAQYQLSDRVSLRQGDCLELNCFEYYDAIYSRDVFLHIADKKRLFSALYAALKPDGKLLFTDYCCAPEPWADEFCKYVSDRGYFLHSVAEYGGLMSQAGFSGIESLDTTQRFIDILQSDLGRIRSLELPGSVRDSLMQSWLGKLARAKSGDQRWGLFFAVKST